MSEATATDRRQVSGLARLYWTAYYLLLRAATGTAFFIAGAAGARWVGLWLTLPLMVCAAALVCGLVAMGLSRSGGRVSYFNRLAVIVLPVGIRLGRGRLIPMFAWSAALWSAVGMAGAICASLWSHGMLHTSTHAPVLRVLLIASLFVDGATFVMLTQQAIKQMTPRSAGLKPLAIILAGLLVLMVGGVGLWLANWPWLAVLLAGGPPAIVAGSYSSFILMRIGTHH